LLWIGQVPLPAEYRAAIQLGRRRALAGDEGIQRRSLRGALEPARLVVETFQGAHFLVAA
jgi:hypothetical protein